MHQNSVTIGVGSKHKTSYNCAIRTLRCSATGPDVITGAGRLPHREKETEVSGNCWFYKRGRQGIPGGIYRPDLRKEGKAAALSWSLYPRLTNDPLCGGGAQLTLKDGGGERLH